LSKVLFYLSSYDIVENLLASSRPQLPFCINITLVASFQSSFSLSSSQPALHLRTRKQPTPPSKDTSTMYLREQLLHTARQWIRVHIDRNIPGIAALATPDFVSHSLPSSLKEPERSRDEYLALQEGFFAMFNT
jgi:hypothetical protein